MQVPNANASSSSLNKPSYARGKMVTKSPSASVKPTAIAAPV
jgi:hypothetical protein